MSAHTPGHMVEIDIEPHQAEALLGVFNEAENAAKAGQRGIVFGQVFALHTKVCFIAEPFASEIRDVITRRAAALRAAKAEAAS